MQSVETMTERILYWLSLDMQVRALAEKLLETFAVTVGDLLASAAHHTPSPDLSHRQGYIQTDLATRVPIHFQILIEPSPKSDAVAKN